MYKKYIGGFIFVLVIIFGFIILSQNQSQPEGFAKPQVVASFYPLYFLAEQTSGDKANVFNMTPAGAEPHDYEPTPQDLIRIENSDLLILNGSGLETWASNITKNIGDKVSIIIAGENLTTKEIEEEGKTIVDPHIWLDPTLAQKMADKITQGLIKIDPMNATYYQNNAITLKNKLANLDSLYKQGLRDCLKKDIITSHAAFGYLASAYGLNQVPISGLSPDAEPSPAELAQIAQFAKKHDVRYIFFESLASSKLSETIAREAGAKTLVLNPIEGLTDEEIAKGHDYFTEMESNLTNLQIALQCKQ